MTDVDSLFGGNGVYPNSTQSGVNWERAASVELIYPDGSTGFQVDAGLRIYGGAFRRMNLTRKKSFRLLFKRDYGPTKLRYRLFEAEDAVASFDTIILRGGANDAWNNWGGSNTQYIVDEFMRRTQLALGRPSAHGTFVHLYLNGLYWGLYNPTERPVESFCASYFGGDKTEWDALNSGAPKGDSNTTTWNAMLSQARAGLSDLASYQKIQGNNPDGTDNPGYDDLLDVESYVDYMFSNFWGGTGDWPWHNWYAGCRRPPNAGGFKFFNWDSEGAIIVWSNLNANVTGVKDGAAVPYVSLRQNGEFCLLFGDQAHRHLFNGGVATGQPSYDRYKELADEVELAIIAESARWGDQARSTPYTLADWKVKRDYILNTYMPQRPAVVLEQLRNAGLYPNVEAPVFYVNGSYRHGGQVSATDLLGMTAAKGTIYYTTDGSDPRLPLAVSSPGDLLTLVPEDAPKRVLVPSVANGGDKLSNTPADFQVTFYKANITVGSLEAAESVVTNPAYRTTIVTEQSRIINFFNTGNPGHFDNDLPFPGTTIGSNVEDFVILATAKIIIPEAGSWTFGVNSDDGFQLDLTNGVQDFACSYPSPRSPGDTLATFNIPQAGPYFLRLLFYERGGGSELELFAAKGSYATFNQNSFHLVGDLAAGGIQVGEDDVWFANYFDDSTWAAGTGGVGYEAGSGNYGDYFNIDVQSEMHNINTTCYIRIPFMLDGGEFNNMILKVRYDDGFIAYLNGARVASRNFSGEPEWNSTASAGHSDSAAVNFETIDISDYTGALWEGQNLLAIHGLNISTGSTDFLISVELVAGEISQGDVSPTAIEYTGPFTLDKSALIKSRAFPNRWSALNEATFSVGPVAEKLRVTEIMYHPPDTGDANDPNKEFIELKNTGSETLNLNLVRFVDGIDFTFPDLDLGAGQFVVVVKDLEAFEAAYGAGVYVAGQYSGSLDNAGERVGLADAAGRTILDFKFKDGWRPLSDGRGFSLTIVEPTNPDPNSWGVKASWRASAFAGGSPGEDDSGILPNPGDVVANEVLAHSHDYAPDWIELHNTTGQAIDIGGWYLSDSDAEPDKYRIADGTRIEPYSYKVFYEDANFGDFSGDLGRIVPFGLSENGEEVVLTSSLGDVLTGYQEIQKFGASETGIAFGRYTTSTGKVHFVPMSEERPGLPNAYPLVGPIVITEIMYNPSFDRDAEFVELYNVGEEAVTLYDYEISEPWKFVDDPDNPGVELVFPYDPPLTMDAGQYVVLVRNLAVFNRYFTVPGGTEVFEWVDGRLDNGGEEIQVALPGDVDSTGTRHYIAVDLVDYDDVAPWPTQADGLGASLARQFAQYYGDDPNNWTAGTPSPGVQNP
ncbi:MAG: lamin tail domain-containing protein [Phycisphaerales bacterium]|nr:MAG: lamin tail domain-containing protein [Phycisphaerales bacterium]